MLLRAPPSTALSLSTAAVDNVNQFPSSSSVRFSSQRRRRRTGNGFSLTSVSDNPTPVTGVVFEPFEEVKKEFELVTAHLLQQSLARHKFSDDCEAAVNYHINWEYYVSYVYHALYAYYDRDNVALRGFAKFFMEASLEERKNAEILMEYQLALSIAKITNIKLLQLQSVADENNDAQLADFVDSTFLADQVETIKKLSKYVSQLRRMGEGHGVWHFDQMLLDA
ncbi:hypothetical protein MKW94_028361 [Papaver nudicaule]|uniref:Ferritin n=1 Tax=Papaver nudicaule TaxID=74823 RepID=A0AA41RV33_PAPNU|nr:hypothetical protein [Papaver nudicaule]